MSAWIVARAHIDALILAGVQWHVIDPGRAEVDAFGRMLWAECLASVAYLYPDDTGDGDRPGPADFQDSDVETYRFSPVELVLEPYAALKVVACYDYQSCEHPGWESSRAHEFTAELRRRIKHELGPAAQSYPTHPLYAAAPWGVEALDALATGACP